MAPSGITSIARLRRARLPTLAVRTLEGTALSSLRVAAPDEVGSPRLPGSVAVWMVPSSSSSSSVGRGGDGAQAMMKTPAKVAPQP